MTIRRCILLFASIFWVASCIQKKKAESMPGIAQLSFIDSVKVIEGNQFFARASQTELIGDSLIAVSSFLTPGIWFIDTRTGEIQHRIVDKEILEISVFPAAFDASKFPFVSILHPKLRSILTFNAVNQTFENKVDLQLPKGKMIRTVESFFLETKDHYLVELYPESGAYQKEFYSKAGHIIGLFDKEGKLVKSMLEYPEELISLSDPIMPYRTFSQSHTPNRSLIGFPSSGIIFELNLNNNYAEREILKIPKNSRHFKFDPEILDKSYNPDFQNHLEVPSSHFFYKIVENENFVILQTDMRDNSKLGEYKALSHLFVYNLNDKQWYETENQYEQVNIGLLAGAAKDTLYFFEGSMKKSEAKYIKRAIINYTKE